MKVFIKKKDKDSKLPVKAYPSDAGYDCFIHSFAVIKGEDDEEAEIINVFSKDVYLHPNNRVLCRLGFYTEIPKGYYFKIVPKSGLALLKGLSITNSPGTIDSGYRNEWGCIVQNLSTNRVKLVVGQKICQIILTKLPEFEFKEVKDLVGSERGQGGFGSTGE